MNLLKIPVFVLIFLISGNIYSQNSEIHLKGDQILELKNNLKKIENTTLPVVKSDINTSTAYSKKSPALAVLLSLIIPGAGHYYIDRMDVGKYFFGADVASWIGYGTLNAYGNDVSNDAKTFSNEHASVSDIDNKNDDYFANVGNYANIYEYNNTQLTFGNYSQLYDVNQYYWSWDNSDNQNIFESQRKSSERIYNNRIIFGSLLIANRIVSGISTYLLTKQGNKKNLSLNILPEILLKKDLTFDGLKVNLVKNF